MIDSYRVWIIKFADAALSEKHFYSEKEAQRAFKAHENNWRCALFETEWTLIDGDTGAYPPRWGI